MNRRHFIKAAIAQTAVFNILPGAGRIWKAVRLGAAPVRVFDEDDLRNHMRECWRMVSAKPGDLFVAESATVRFYQGLAGVIQTHSGDFCPRTIRAQQIVPIPC